ncbi:ZBT40 protein, partial [Columbina picui]|nr:ZBT40 protein [Columbina picui]
MELPGYSRQLLQQLYPLCREQQFCDCAIFIGNVRFGAHKVVLAAASLLFKSLLDSTDTISIDASVVTPEEFALLLEMMYSGKLPLGKHNFTKVISVADSLQMFDVAVSCKNLLRDLISCSTQDQVVREVSSQAADSSGNPTEPNNLPQSEKPAEGRTDILLQRVSSPGPAEAEMEADVSPAGQELTMGHAWVHQGAMPSDSRSLQEDLPMCWLQTDAFPSHHAFCESLQLANNSSCFYHTAAESKSCKLDFFLRYESVFSEALSDARAVRKRLEESSEIDTSQKEALAACLEEGGDQPVFQKLLSKVQDAQTLLSLLKLFQDTNPKLRAALLERDGGSGEALQQTESADEGETLTARLLGCREELIQSVTQLSPIIEFLEAAEEGFLTTAEKRVVLDCCGGSQREAMDKLLRKVEEEKTLKAESLVKLLGAVKASFPGLHLLLDNLMTTANASDGKAKCSPEDYGTKLLRRYRENLVELLTDTRTLLQGISAAQSLAPAEREVSRILCKMGCVSNVLASFTKQSMVACFCFSWLLLEIWKGKVWMDMRRSSTWQRDFSSGFSKQLPSSRDETKWTCPHAQTIPTFHGPKSLSCDVSFLILQLLSISAQKESSEASLKAALSTAQEKSVPAIKICQLLCNVHESFPDLQPVMQELGHVGLLTEGNGEKPGIRKWKVNSESQIEALDKDEDKAGGAGAKEPKGPQEKASSKKNFVCKACDKTFHFYCRLKVHMKRCRVARGKQIQCKECSEVKSTKKELEKHQLEVHGVVGTAKKKKKRLPVACDICGREFAHASGMQYHKLTEHFDEKPFSCEECGAKFAANSTLKNHLRLHTGDRPFTCKHCLMTFMQASALAYHTKKKHAEGEPSLWELAMGLACSIHHLVPCSPVCLLPSSSSFWGALGRRLLPDLLHPHDIEDPYDCKKCRMSFATLQEHRKHVHEAHSREYHPCPTCSKVFSAPSLLERHMVTHVGGKPFSCDLCDKAYQQLSGLWYHNRTHHPDVFAAQNHRSSKFSSLQCSSCDKTFSSTAAHRKHVKAEHTALDVLQPWMYCSPGCIAALAVLQPTLRAALLPTGSHPFCCLYCSASFPVPGALQNHVTSEHFKQTESTFTCELCGELFPSQGELEGHCNAEHPKVIFSQATTAQIVQVIQTSEQGAAEHIISFDEAQLTGSQVFVTLPESQVSQAGSELVAVTMEDLFDDKVTLICEGTK